MAQLNIDVLCLVCSFLTDVPDVLSFSLTCSALRPTAVAQRMSMRPVTLVGASSIRHLHNFVFADKNQQRAQHICAVTIPVQPVLSDPPEELVDRLLAILTSATNLRTLSIYIPDEPSTLFSHSKLPTVISHITSLQELAILSLVPLAIELLASTRSGLKTFRHSDAYQGSSEDSVPSTTTLAPQLASTLQNVELSHRFLDTAFAASLSLPGARSLTLTGVTHLFQLRTLLAVFPNLDRTLVIEDCIYAGDIDDPPEPLREENRAAQRAHRGWAALDRVATSPLVLWSLGLACPIRHLSLRMALPDYLVRLGDLDRARIVLEEHAPTHLALVGIRLLSGPDEVSTQDLGRGLFQDAASVAKLTHLVLSIEYTNEDLCLASHWAVVLHTLLAALAALTNLAHLHIVFIRDLEDSPQHPPKFGPVYHDIHTFDFERFVAALTAGVPSLSHVFITSAGRWNSDSRRGEEEAWETSRAWRVRRPCAVIPVPVPGSEGFELEELGADDPEAEIEREGMRATARTEWIQIAREEEDDGEVVSLT